jgi:hypothetical protein
VPAKQGKSLVLQVFLYSPVVRRLPTMYGCVRDFAGQGRGRTGGPIGERRSRFCDPTYLLVVFL